MPKVIILVCIHVFLMDIVFINQIGSLRNMFKKKVWACSDPQPNFILPAAKFYLNISFEFLKYYVKIYIYRTYKAVYPYQLTSKA